MIPNEPTTNELDGALLEDDRLMRLYDGELDPEQEAELLGLLDAAIEPRAIEAHRKLATMTAIGSMLREQAEADSRGDGIADAVMAALEGVDGSVGRGVDSSKSSSDGAPMAKVDSLPRVEPQGPLGARPANDNSRSIFAVAGLAAAAAAALFVWGRTQPIDAGLAVAPLAEAPMVAELSARVEPAPQGAASPAGDDGDAGVEVAAVDLGSHDGSVFYVRGEDSATAVVWINDAGDDQ